MYLYYIKSYIFVSLLYTKKIYSKQLDLSINLFLMKIFCMFKMARLPNCTCRLPVLTLNSYETKICGQMIVVRILVRIYVKEWYTFGERVCNFVYELLWFIVLFIYSYYYLIVNKMRTYLYINSVMLLKKNTFYKKVTLTIKLSF